MSADIAKYRKALTKADAQICEQFEAAITSVLSKAEGKVWHGHPVWFIDGNPVVGYSKKKAGIELLFWSGQSFETTGLKAIGSYQAAAYTVTSADEVKISLVKKWLRESKAIQWDYANLPKKRKLEKLTDF